MKPSENLGKFVWSVWPARIAGFQKASSSSTNATPNIHSCVYDFITS